MIFSRGVRCSWIVFFVVGVWAAPGAAQFTESQAIAGGKAYEQHCAVCHGAQLEGAGIAPPLSGNRFDQSWRGKSADVLSFHIRRMPPAMIAEGTALTDETYTNIQAYLLESNGVTAGDLELPADLDALATLTIPQLEGLADDPVLPVVRSATQSALLQNLPKVTDEMLRDPAPGDWLHWGRTYSGQSHSPLSQINKKNVKGLVPAWRTPLLHGPSMPMPLVHQGVMFLHTYPDTVLAMDATNGAVLWRYQREGLSQSSKKMGLSLFDDRIYAATSDLHVIALNARTGELVWDHALDYGFSDDDEDEEERPIFARSAPLIAGDMVIQGTMSFRVAKGSYIFAMDRKTGKEAWRFNTVAWPGQPGGNTWNGIPVEKRNGGSVWQQGTYDPESNLVYFGVAPT